jgi:hypothetical protein
MRIRNLAALTQKSYIEQVAQSVKQRVILTICYAAGCVFRGGPFEGRGD